LSGRLDAKEKGPNDGYKNLSDRVDLKWPVTCLFFFRKHIKNIRLIREKKNYLV
jgi:hypothetical protein